MEVVVKATVAKQESLQEFLVGVVVPVEVVEVWTAAVHMVEVKTAVEEKVGAVRAVGTKVKGMLVAAARAAVELVVEETAGVLPVGEMLEEASQAAGKSVVAALAEEMWEAVASAAA